MSAGTGAASEYGAILYDRDGSPWLQLPHRRGWIYCGTSPWLLDTEMSLHHLHDYYGPLTTSKETKQ